MTDTDKDIFAEQAIAAIKSNYPPSSYSMLRDALDFAIKDMERNKAAIEFARFYRKNVRDGSYKAGSARELQTIMASVLTGILKILEGN